MGCVSPIVHFPRMRVYIPRLTKKSLAQKGNNYQHTKLSNLPEVVSDSSDIKKGKKIWMEYTSNYL